MREPLGIVITTYNRLSTAVPTIESFRDNLQYDRRFWVIADDGSPDGYVDQLVALLPNEEIYVTNAERRGVGHSKNLGLAKAFELTSVVLLSEDDWQLKYPLDIRSLCDTLVSNPQVGMIRMGYLSVPTSGSCDLVGYNNMSYIRLKVNPNDMYTYSGQVSLRSRNFYSTIGWHSEGLNAGQEELDMCRRYNACPNPPEILWPGNMGFHFQLSAFLNIGMDSSLNNIQPEK